MSMSDDEESGVEDADDEDSMEDEKENALTVRVLEETEDVVEPALFVRAPRTSPSSPRVSRMRSGSGSGKRGSTSVAEARRRSTIESLFAPLTNFIDLRERDRDGATATEEGDGASSRSSRSWRSFVEIGP